MRRMKPLHPIDDSTLIDLAHGLTPNDQREEVLEHLRSCSECEQRFRVLVAERERTRASVPDGVFAPAHAARVLPRGRRAGRIAAAVGGVLAAALILVAVLREDAVEYWIPVDEEALVLRSTVPSDQPVTVDGALDAYVRRDARAAIQQLEALDVDAGDVTAVALRDLFLASARVNERQYAEAEDVLDRMSVDTLPIQWRREARWVRYLALSGLGRDAQALPLLDTLADEPGEIGRLAKVEIERRR